MGKPVLGRINFIARGCAIALCGLIVGLQVVVNAEDTYTENERAALLKIPDLLSNSKIRQQFDQIKLHFQSALVIIRGLLSDIDVEFSLAKWQFRELVKPRLTEDYMNSDSYLIKWLRARNFDLNASTEMLKHAIDWRKTNRMDSILTEDLSSIYKRAPYALDGLDNVGRPVLAFNPGRWDIRRFATSGELPKLNRFLDQTLEKLRARVTEFGHNITQGVAILDLDGYNFRQHGCLQCPGPLLDWIRHYENYYPGLLAALHVINNPRIFSPLLDIIRPLFSQQTSKILHLHGPDRNEWSRKIFEAISSDQLSPQYGGTKMRR